MDGRWYYWRRTPKGLEADLGKLIKRALKTSDRDEAARRWRGVHDEIESRIEKAKGRTKGHHFTDIEDSTIRACIDIAWSEWHRQKGEGKQFRPEQFLDLLVEHLGEALRWTFSPYALGKIKYSLPDVLPTMFAVRLPEVEEVVAVHRKIHAPATIHHRPVMLRDLIEKFEGDINREDLSPTTKGNHRPGFDIITDVFGEDRDIRLIDRDDIKRVREIMLWLPTYAKKRPEFKEMPFAEIAEITREKYYACLRQLEAMGIDDPDEETARKIGMPTFLERSAVNKYLGGISQLFQWGMDEGLLASTPAANIKLRNVAGSKKRGFTEEELRLLFHRDYVFDPVTWIPVVCLHQGFRPSECAQLNVGDLVKSERTGLWSLRITVEERKRKVAERLRLPTSGPDTRTKNKFSVRTIPLHQKLVDIGFVDFVQARKAAGERKMFAVTKYGQYGYYESVRGKLTALLSEAGVHSPETTMHSLRHTFAQAMRDLFPENQQIREAIGGWSVSGSAEIDYGSERFCPESLKPYLDRVEYPGLFMVARPDREVARTG